MLTYEDKVYFIELAGYIITFSAGATVAVVVFLYLFFQLNEAMRNLVMKMPPLFSRKKKVLE